MPRVKELAAGPDRTDSGWRDDADLDQIDERLRWSPAERLQYLLDMLAFEERARKARPVV